MKVFVSTSGVSEEKWNDMSAMEKRAYLKKHPNSKYNKKAQGKGKSRTQTRAKFKTYQDKALLKAQVKDAHQLMDEAEAKVASLKKGTAKYDKAVERWDRISFKVEELEKKLHAMGVKLKP